MEANSPWLDAALTGADAVSQPHAALAGDYAMGIRSVAIVEVLAADFARGQRRHVTSPASGDFATGLRAHRLERPPVGDFATGVRAGHPDAVPAVRGDRSARARRQSVLRRLIERPDNAA